MVLGIVLISFLMLWGLADVVVWIMGGETLSQWVVKRSRANKRFAWAIMIGLPAFTLWLLWHWDLFEILF